MSTKDDWFDAQKVSSEFAKSSLSDALLIDDFQNFSADAALVKSVSVRV